LKALLNPKPTNILEDISCFNSGVAAGNSQSTMYLSHKVRDVAITVIILFVKWILWIWCRWNYYCICSLKS